MTRLAAILLLALTSVSCFSCKSITTVAPPVQQSPDEAVTSRLLQVKKVAEATPEVGLWTSLNNFKWISPDSKYKVNVELLNDRTFALAFFALKIQEGSTDSRVLFTFYEADAGSGADIQGRWTTDSKALRVKVRTLGFDYNHSPQGPARQYDYIYLADEGKLYATPEN